MTTLADGIAGFHQVASCWPRECTTLVCAVAGLLLLGIAVYLICKAPHH